MSDHTEGRLHTGEQHHFSKVDINDAQGSRVGVANSPSDARRLVACWNACEGITTETIQEHASAIGERLITRVARTAERDKLIEALRQAESFIEGTVEMSQSSYDLPPEPKTETDYCAAVLAMDLRALLAKYPVKP